MKLIFFRSGNLAFPDLAADTPPLGDGVLLDNPFLGHNGKQGARDMAAVVNMASVNSQALPDVHVSESFGAGKREDLVDRRFQVRQSALCQSIRCCHKKENRWNRTSDAGAQEDQARLRRRLGPRRRRAPCT